MNHLTQDQREPHDHFLQCFPWRVYKDVQSRFVKLYLFNLLAVISLLLWIALATVWMRSLTVSEQWEVDYGRPLGPKGENDLMVEFVAFNGSFEIDITHLQIPDRPALLLSCKIVDNSAPDSGWSFGHERPCIPGPFDRTTFWQKCGFTFDGAVNSSDFGTERWWRAAVPIWLILLMLTPIPAQAALALAMRRRRRRNSKCVSCGYDLRATPDKCPECGAVPKRKKKNGVEKTTVSGTISGR